jgi:hypothetical protein
MVRVVREACGETADGERSATKTTRIRKTAKLRYLKSVVIFVIVGALVARRCGASGADKP